MLFDVNGCLELDKIKERLSEFAMSYLGKKLVHELAPATERSIVQSWLDETDEAVKLIEHGASVPIPSLDGVESVAAGLGKGLLLSVSELALVGGMLESIAQLRRFMAKRASIAPRITSYALSLYELNELKNELERCIRHGQIADQASGDLMKIRKKIAIVEERLKKKLDGIMQRSRSYLQEQVIIMRGDRYALPVKKEFRKQLSGTVLDESASGQTVFIEPAETALLTYELSALRAEEGREETKVLGRLTDFVEGCAFELNVNLQTIGHYDFLFAKAKYALATGANKIQLNGEGILTLQQARHPLLGSKAIPLDFAIGESFRALIITGPNTGGKTVALKTAGLLAMMVQCGLLVPAAAESSFCIFEQILVDIGDGQSLEQSLSTFSAHMKQMIRILQTAGRNSFILLDELAAGTDPGEGVGLSAAVLEELYSRGATIVATTHFNEIKQFAEATDGFENARMEFDLATLEPQYRLKIGEAGHSYAFQIASKLGMPEGIIRRSMEFARRGAAAEQSGGTNRLQPEEGKPGGSGQRGRHTAKSGQRRDAQAKETFEIGDCVWVHSLRRTGIVGSLPDERGNVTVMVQKEKIKVNRKRLSLYIEKKQLYPESGYDMDIVFESKEVRKKRKIMSKRHDESAAIIRPADS